MNIVILQGRPTKEPELRRSASGKVFCKLRYAVDRTYTGKDRKSDYFNVIFFDRKAQTVYNNLAKGALSTIMGELRQDSGGTNECWVLGSKCTIHDWLRKHRPLDSLNTTFDDLELIPREAAQSLYKQIDIDDEDIPDDLAGKMPDI